MLRCKEKIKIEDKRRKKNENKRAANYQKIIGRLVLGNNMKA